MVMRNCVVCGVEFDARGIAKTCSPAHGLILKKQNLQKWQQENPERVRESSRKYRAANLEKVRETHCKYRAANLEKVRKTIRQWAIANPEKANETYSTYRRKQRIRKTQIEAQFECNQLKEE